MNKYRLILPGHLPEIERLLDISISQPNVNVEIPDAVMSRRLGHWAKPFIRRGIFTLYPSPRLGEKSVFVCKVKSVKKSNGVGRNIYYDFEIPYAFYP